jgi:tellurite resistance protein
MTEDLQGRQAGPRTAHRRSKRDQHGPTTGRGRDLSPGPAIGRRRIPLNVFGIPFGLSGLAGCWVAAAEQDDVPAAIGNVLLAIAALVWLVTLVSYLRYALSRDGSLVDDLVDKIAGPFSSLAVITPLLLAAEGVFPHAPAAGTVLVDVFVVLTVVFGGWFTGQWIYGPLDIDRLHPGYFLPTVAGGLIAAEATADVGQIRLARVMFGLGVICWFILGSMIMARLFFRPPLPPPLMPTVAIELAPPAVATIAYFAINSGRTDPVAAFFAGYGILMVLAQLRLLPAYLRINFGISTWAFTFSTAAVVTAALYWNEFERPAGHVVYAYLLLAAITGLIGWIAVRTARALLKDEFLPQPS